MRLTLILSTSEPARLEAFRAVVTGLREEGHDVTVRLPFDAEDAALFARAAAEEGAERIVAAGGDGTLHHVANGLGTLLEAGGSAPPVGIVPLGTGNDFAGGLGIPEAPEEALRVALEGTPRPVDLCRVNDRYFLNVSVGGITAEATEETPEDAKELLGAFAYALTGVRKLIRLSPSRARFRAAEGEVYDGPFLFYAVGNGPRTGAGNRLTPRADPGDGLLDLCLVRAVSRLELLALLPRLRAGTHLDDPAVLYRRVPRLDVEPESAISVNVDGEPLSGESYLYEVSRHRLEVMVDG